MKKITLQFLLLFSLLSFGQKSTTIDEYNYMTKGYKIAITSGLDIKQGYRIQDFIKKDFSEYSFDYKFFIRDDNSLSGIIIIATSKVWGNVYFYSIPINNLDLLNDFNSNIQKLDFPMLTAYSISSNSILSSLFDIQFNK